MAWSPIHIALLGASILFGGEACSPKETNDAPAGPPCNVTIDRFKELTIVDESVVKDLRAKNARGGPWSFRYAIESMAPPGTDPGDLVLNWLMQWVVLEDFNGVKLDREPRDFAMISLIICPWLHRDASNACDAQCGNCARRKLDLGLAPFRLVGIVNRMDLRERPDENPLGEVRFAYALTDGPGDDPASVAKPMSVVIEYAPPDASVVDWAQGWHQLGTYPKFDEPYKAALETLTDRVMKRGAAPGKVNGSALAQIRTNESVLDWIWQLRQFGLDEHGNLVLTAVTDTPAESFNGTQALSTMIQQNADAIKANKFVVPTFMLPGSSDSFMFRWNAPGIDEATRNAFARITCSGCHSGEVPIIDTAFQMSPFRQGTAKLSLFLNNPNQPGGDELLRREGLLKAALCSQ
jgi:hypothetical protein